MNKRIKKKQQTMDLKKKYLFAKRHGFTREKFDDWKHRREVIRKAISIFGNAPLMKLAMAMEVTRLMRFGRYY